MLLTTVSLAKAAKLAHVHLWLLVVVSLEQTIASMRVLLLLLMAHVSKEVLWCHVHRVLLV